MQKLYRTISFLLAFVILSNTFSSQHISASDLSQSEYDLSLGTSPENERGLIEETLYSDKLAVNAEAEPYIISEIKSKRTENTKYFKLSSGAYCAVQYDIPVHYRSADGTWSDYDNTLTASAKNDLLSADSLLRLQTKSSDKSISLAPYATGNGDISIEKDGYAVSWGYKKAVKPASGAAKAVSFVFASESENIKRVPAEITSLSKTRSAEAEGNDSFLVLRDLREEIYYRDVFEEADLQYIISPEGIKENIILKSGSAASEYRSVYQTGELEAVQTDEKTIILKGPDGDTIFIITAPCMTDSAGAVSNEVTMEITSRGEGYINVKVAADREWITAPEREFPIYVDPSIHTSQEWCASSSSYISSLYPNNSYGPGGNSYEGSLYVGKTSGRGNVRTLIKADSLPELNNGDIIVGAYVSLLQRKDDATMRIDAHKVTSSWTMANATWNRNITYDSKVSDYVDIKAGTGDLVRTFNITDMAKGWYNGEANNGLILISPEIEEGSRNHAAGFYSSSSIQVPDGVRPTFTIIYRNNKGLESYWTYTNVGAGRAGTAYINDYTGNLVFIQGGVSTAGNLMPAAITHVYNGYMANQKYTETTPYVGMGWRLNIQQTLFASSKFGLSGTDAENFPYVYTDGDGTDHYFYKKTENGTTKYIDEDGLGLELTINSGSTAERYKIKDDQGNIISFKSNGILNYISDANGNKNTVNYLNSGQKITGVTDGAGRQIKILSGSGSTSYMTAYEDPAGRKYQYTFSSSGMLQSIKYPDGLTVSYGYDSDGALNEITDVDGYKIKIYYTSKKTGKMVSRIEEYGTENLAGQVVTFDRSKKNSTVIRSSGKDGIYGNSDDIITEYQFDDYGRTTSAQSLINGKSLGSAGYRYTAGEKNAQASNIKTLNRISQSHLAGENTVNLVTNSSAEGSGSWTAASWIGTCNFTAEMTTSQKYLGQKAFKISVSNYYENGRARYHQDFPNTVLKRGETYTLSAYVKTVGLSNTKKNYGACIMADSFNSDGSYTKFYSEYLYGTTDTAINNGWRRLSVTFTVPQNSNMIRVNLTVREAVGTAYFDAVQIEKGEAVSPYNLLENPSFEKYSGNLPTGWQGNLTDSGDYVTTSQSHEGTTGFKFKGDPSKNKFIYQELNISGTEQDIYVVSAWAKANAVPLDEEDLRKFRISIRVTFSDGTYLYKTPAVFNHSVTGWQYVSTAFNLDDGTSTVKTPVKIRVELLYKLQMNEAYYDQVQLIKDTSQSYVYNSEGKLVNSVENAEQKSSMEYTGSDLTKYTSANGYDYKYEYDSKHNLTKAESQRGIQNIFTYDSKGQATSVTVKNPAGTLGMKADAQYTTGFLTKITDNDGNEINYVYNTNTGTLLNLTDSSGTTEYTYDADSDKLKEVSKTISEDKEVSVSYTYDKDRLLGISHNGTNYWFGYDAFGNTVQTKVGNKVLATYTYGPKNGLLQRVTFGNGNYIDYTYDEKCNVKSISYNGTEKHKFITDNAGRTTRYIDSVNNMQYDYEYDSIGRLVRTNVVDITKKDADDRSPFRSEYSYDKNNNVSKFVAIDPNRTMTSSYIYGKDNCPEKYTMFSGRTILYSYDTLGRLSGKTIGTDNNVAVTYAYKQSDRNTESGGMVYTTGLVSEESAGGRYTKYEYDSAGNIIRIYEKNSQSAAYAVRASYEYNKLNQLIRENDAELGKSKVYAYDEGGNISQIKEYNYTEGTLPGTPLKTINYGYGDSDWKDLLTSYNGQTISYDEIGNPLTYRDGMSMEWEDGRKLKSLQTSDHMITYKYDSSGLRYRKTVDGEESIYRYEGGKLIYEKRGNISLSYQYDSSGNLSTIYYVLADKSTLTYYVHCNARGDVEYIYNSVGVIRAKYSYDAWGNILSITDGDGNEVTGANHIGRVNRILYRGYYYDEETGLYYVSSRYYDPEIGRWINADSQLNTSLGILGCNMFAYCLNNPVNKVDYDGNKPGDLFDTMDEAARDFAEYINAKSIEDNREYASYIYTKTVTETRTTTYINPNIFGNNPLSWLWNVIFGGGLTKTVTTKVKITKYTYREPKRGTVDSSSPPINWFGIHTVVGRLHTHAAYDPAYANDIFSSADKRNAERQGVPTYVATPLGTLRKYDPSNGTDIVLFNDIPFDPNHPGR